MRISVSILRSNGHRRFRAFFAMTALFTCALKWKIPNLYAIRSDQKNSQAFWNLRWTETYWGDRGDKLYSWTLLEGMIDNLSERVLVFPTFDQSPTPCCPQSRSVHSDVFIVFITFSPLSSRLWISLNVWNTNLGTWAVNSSAKHRSRETHQDWPREPQSETNFGKMNNWIKLSHRVTQVLEGIKVLWQGCFERSYIANIVWITSFPNPSIQNHSKTIPLPGAPSARSPNAKRCHGNFWWGDSNVANICHQISTCLHTFLCDDTMTANSKNARSDCFLPVSTFHNSNFTRFMYHLELSHSTCYFIKLIFLHHLYHLWFSISVSTQFLLVLLPFQFLRHILDVRWPLRDFAKRLGTKTKLKNMDQWSLQRVGNSP